VSGILIGLPLLAFSIYLDYRFYGKLTFPPLNFFHFNVLTEGSSLFGEHPWHYFITWFMQDYLKNFFLIYIFSFIYFTYKDIKAKVFPDITLIIIFYVTVLSLVKHKES
jgi:GPI mannosyltransferase 3